MNLFFCELRFMITFYLEPYPLESKIEPVSLHRKPWNWTLWSTKTRYTTFKPGVKIGPRIVEVDVLNYSWSSRLYRRDMEVQLEFSRTLEPPLPLPSPYQTPPNPTTTTKPHPTLSHYHHHHQTTTGILWSRKHGIRGSSNWIARIGLENLFYNVFGNASGTLKPKCAHTRDTFTYKSENHKKNPRAPEKIRAPEERFRNICHGHLCHGV